MQPFIRSFSDHILRFERIIKIANADRLTIIGISGMTLEVNFTVHISFQHEFKKQQAVSSINVQFTDAKIIKSISEFKRIKPWVQESLNFRIRDARQNMCVDSR